MTNFLYFISTPIGNLKDFSQRGIEILSSVDIILCEDTRVSIKLLQNLGIKARLDVYNDHNATFMIPKIINLIVNDKKTFALISDAGTPLISDPGFKLARTCRQEGIKFSVVPGCCSVIAALTLAGLPTNRFLFDGFAESKKFKELSEINSTIVLFESARRIVKTLQNMKGFFDDREISISREITKIYEETVNGTLDQLIDHFQNEAPRGEFVLVISSPSKETIIEKKLNSIKPLLETLYEKMSLKDISDTLSDYSGLSKNIIYNFINGEKTC